MNINEALIKGYSELKEAGIDTYQLDTQLLMCHVINQSKLYIIMNRDRELSKEDYEAFQSLVLRRKTREPMAYILNDVEFMGIDFYVEQGVLIPRPDTEVLVEECIHIIKERKTKNICDMCCGSGAIGISIAALTEDTKVAAFDISDYAIRVSNINVERQNLGDRVTVEKSDLFEVAEVKNMKFDMIVSNPPYIEEEVIPTLMEDVKDYEPHLALSGGEDGLDFYRKICDKSTVLLNHDGYLCFEIGYNQEEAVKKLMEERNFVDVYGLKDLAGNSRVVIGRLA